MFVSGTAIATKSGSRYNFTLDHKAAYLTFMPYNQQGAIDGAYITQIKVTADQAIAGEFNFNDNGIDLTSRPIASATNQSITLTLNNNFTVPGGTIPDPSKNAAIMVLAPGTYGTLTVEYTLRDNTTQKSGTITKTYNNLTLTAGKNRRVVTDLQVTDYSPWLNYFYQWDAKAPYWDGVTLPDVLENNTNYDSYGTRSANSNYSTAYNGYGVVTNAVNSCTIAPNANEMLYYKTYGDPHYDNKTPWTFKGHLYTGGLWLKKRSVIYNDLKAAGYSQLTSQTDMKEKFYFSSSDATGIDFRTTYQYLPSTPTRDIPASTSDYFFLPMLGSFSTGTLNYVGRLGIYWSSSGDPLNSLGLNAYLMGFQEDEVIIMGGYRPYASVLQPFE